MGYSPSHIPRGTTIDMDENDPNDPNTDNKQEHEALLAEISSSFQTIFFSQLLVGLGIVGVVRYLIHGLALFFCFLMVGML